MGGFYWVTISYLHRKGEPSKMHLELVTGKMAFCITIKQQRSMLRKYCINFELQNNCRKSGLKALKFLMPNDVSSV